MVVWFIKRRKFSVTVSHIFVVDLQLLWLLIKFKPRFPRIPWNIGRIFLKIIFFPSANQKCIQSKLFGTWNMISSSFQITNMSILPIKTWHWDSFSNVKHIENILINIFVKYFCWGNAFIFTSWKWTKSIDV